MDIITDNFRYALIKFYFLVLLFSVHLFLLMQMVCKWMETVIWVIVVMMLKQSLTNEMLGHWQIFFHWDLYKLIIAKMNMRGPLTLIRLTHTSNFFINKSLFFENDIYNLILSSKHSFYRIFVFVSTDVPKFPLQ